MHQQFLVERSSGEETRWQIMVTVFTHVRHSFRLQVLPLNWWIIAVELSCLCLASCSIPGTNTGRWDIWAVWHPACDMYGSCLALLWR